MDVSPQTISVHGGVEPELLQPAPRPVRFRFFGTYDQWILLSVSLCSLPVVIGAFSGKASWFTAFWLGFAALWWHSFFSKARVEKHLVQNGAVGRATVSRKYQEAKDWRIEYEWTAPSSHTVVGAPAENKTFVSVPYLEWSSFEEGKEFSILFDPLDPKVHTPYFACYFKAK